MTAKGRRRGFKSWFVEPYRQVKLGLMFLIVNLIFSILVLGVFGFYLWDVYKTIMAYFQLSAEQGNQVVEKFNTPLFAGSGLIAIFVITTILVSVRYTHEIYGPLVSIHRFLDDVLGNRSVKPLQLRESDQLKDLAVKLNQLAERQVGDQRQAPLVPIHKFLDDLLERRNPDPIQLRDSDQFRDLAGKLNRLAEIVKSQKSG